MHALMMSVHFYPLKLRVPARFSSSNMISPIPKHIIKIYCLGQLQYQLLYQSEYQTETSGAHTKIISRENYLYKATEYTETTKEKTTTRSCALSRTALDLKRGSCVDASLREAATFSQGTRSACGNLTDRELWE